MNNYLSYTSRDFDSIKNDLTNAIPSLTNIWTSREQSDVGMVLVTLMSALGDNLSFNMDAQSLEFFGKTVTQRKNAQNIFDLLGYKMHWYEGAQLEITISNLSETDALNLNFNPTNLSSTQTLSSNTVTSVPYYFILNPNESPYNWNENTRVTIPANQSMTFIAVQGALNSINFNSATIDSNNRFYLPTSKIDQNHIWLADEHDSYKWYLTDNINELAETLPRFEFGVDEYSLPYIEFVPYWKSSFGNIDGTDTTFTLYYLSTEGSDGDVTDNVLNFISNITALNENISQVDFYNNISISHSTNAYYTDNINNIPGKDPESAREAYLASKNLIGTYNTLVTVKDFERFYKRLGLISNSLVIDGQRARDINKSVKDTFNRVIYEKTGYIAVNTLPTSDIQSDVIYLLCQDDGDYKKGSYKYANSAWELISDLDENGFEKNLAQVYLVASNFLVSDPLNPAKKYATLTSVIPEPETNPNAGYIKYELTDNVIGQQSDSLVNQSNLASYKLISADLQYCSVRKFPFFIDGKIHLKEPVAPATANLILQNAYNAVYFNFVAANLKFGEKIKFSDIIAAVSSADPAIDYFDAGANNSNGSLFISPTVDNLNPYDMNENGTLNNYNVNIDTKYFNASSLQHYEDMLNTNNAYIYWGNTSSGALSIDETSIAYKITPNTSTLDVEAQMSEELYIASIFNLDQNTLSLFEYAFVKELHTVDLDPNRLNENINNNLVLTSWTPSNIFEISTLPQNGITQWHYIPYIDGSYDHAEVLDQTHFVLALRMKPTITTNQSNILLISCSIDNDLE